MGFAVFTASIGKVNARTCYWSTSPQDQVKKGGGFTDHLASWGDFCTLLQMPRDQSRLRGNAQELIRTFLSADNFELFDENDGVPVGRIFVNMIPVIIGAGSEFLPDSKPHIHAASTEGGHLLWHLENVEQANFGEPKYLELISSVFG